MPLFHIVWALCSLLLLSNAQLSFNEANDQVFLWVNSTDIQTVNKWSLVKIAPNNTGNTYIARNKAMIYSYLALQSTQKNVSLPNTLLYLNSSYTFQVNVTLQST